MRDKPLLVVSDLHLGAVPESTERAFLDFLRAAADRASGLLINGDLFDFWFEYRTVIPAKHFRTLAALADLVAAGVPIWFVGGNHDAWGGAFLQTEVGVEVLKGPVEMRLVGRRVLVAHGDGVGRGDLGYRALRRVLHSPLAIRAFRALHPDLGARVAALASSTDEKAEGELDSSRSRAAFIRGWAEERLAEDPGLDLVLAGHAHLPAVAEIAPGRFYANSGDWIRHYTYLELRPERPRPVLRRWVPGERA